MPLGQTSGRLRRASSRHGRFRCRSRKARWCRASCRSKARSIRRRSCCGWPRPGGRLSRRRGARARAKPLTMRAYKFGQELNAGVWGIREPKPEAPEVDPDILIVPLAAFDRKGHRIGYGAAYYDMTINRLRGIKPVVAVGIAYAAQEVPEVPVDTHDAILDLVLTER